MTSLLRISAADLGTNTLKVTHAARDGDGALLDMQHASDTVRLGAGIEATGRIEDHRIDLCLAFLKEQEAVGRAFGSTVFIGVATEALRIAANGAELMEKIRTQTAWQIEIITGHREAELTYLGLQDQVPVGGDCAICDIGGGSTELVILRDGHVTRQESLAVGSGRLADRLFTSDPPGKAAEIQAIEAARDLIASVLGAESPVGFVMLAGGSGLFMNMLIEQLVSLPPFDLRTLGTLADHLATTPAQETVERIDIPLARALVLPASVAVGVAMMEHLAADSALGVPSGIRMGLIREYQG